MSNRAKYNSVFIETFSVEEKTLSEKNIEYNTIKEWDSIGHMTMVAELEDVFDIEMDYRNQYDLTVKDHGTLQVDNLVVPTSREMTRWTHRDNAKININGMRTPEQGEWMPIWQSMSDDVTYTADNSDIGITAIALANDDGAVTTNGTVAITNSDLNVELAFPVGSRTITLPDANTRVESWSIDTGIDIDVVDSNLGRVDFDVTPGAHITLQDSSNIHFGWAMGFRQSLEGEAPSATITDLRGGGALYSRLALTC